MGKGKDRVKGKGSKYQKKADSQSEKEDSSDDKNEVKDLQSEDSDSNPNHLQTQIKSKIQPSPQNKRDSDDDDSNNNTKLTLRKHSCQFDQMFKVPLCYAKFFQPIKEQNKGGKVEIKVVQNRTRKITKLSWTGNIFKKEDLNEICKYIKDKIQTSCSIDKKEPRLLSFAGREPRLLRDYLIERFKISIKDITMKDIPLKAPSNFKMKIVIDEEQDDHIEIIFYYKNWDNPMFFEFIDNFKEDMQKEYDVQLFEENDHNKKLSIVFIGDNLSDAICDYACEKCQMRREQINIDRKLILSRKYSKVNAYKKMKEVFQNLEPSSYFREMADTIRDTYKYEREELSHYVLHIDVHFNFIFTDDDGNNYYNTQIDILNAFPIDSDKTGQKISEGNVVTILHKQSNAFIIGHITKIINGLITVVFILKPNQIPPGSSTLPKDQSNNKYDYIEANFSSYDEYRKYEQFEDEEEKDDMQNDDDMQNNKLGRYKVTFQPNNSRYTRSAMSLLVLNDIESGIKDIITCDSNSYNEKMNFVGNETIPNIDEPMIANFLTIHPTPSQKDCIINILQNRVSLIQGPPGCGKTTSISFFVYTILKMHKNERKRILLCAYSNQAVENIVKAVNPVVKELGKKMVWIPNQSMRFETKEDYENASTEEKYLSYCKILDGCDKKGCETYRELQEKRWAFEKEMDRYNKELARNGAIDFKWDDNFKPFTEYDLNKMKQIQNEVEEKFVSESDVVCCTLLQSGKRSVVDFKFEYLFVDEATQVDQINSLIPLIHQPSRMILLGDHKQLDPFIPEPLQEAHPFSTQSLYLYLIGKGVKSVMLRTQFRMHPKIAMFPSHEFYDDQIINADGIEERTASSLCGIKTPILFVDVKDGHDIKTFGLTYHNQREAEVVSILLHNFKINNIPPSQVGVITPYAGQKDLIRYMTMNLNYNARISSVDSFQGSERDYIILSLVRANQDGNVGFLANANRINVSITRARKGLIIVGNYNSIERSNLNNKNPKSQFLVNLCHFYKEQNAVVDSSEIKKVFKVPIRHLKIEVVKPPKPKPKVVDDDDDPEYDNDDDD